MTTLGPTGLPIASYPLRRRAFMTAVTPMLAVVIGLVPADVRAETWTGQSVVVAGRYDQEQFAAGETVRITAQVKDGIFAAGREVEIDGASADSLHAMAGTLDFRRGSVRELVAGGLAIEIHGTVEDDAIIGVCPVCPWASGRVLIGKDARIGDELYAAGRTIEIRGTVGGNLGAAARTIIIAGTVGGSAGLNADEIVIEPGTRIDGELSVRSPNLPVLPADSAIAGPVNYMRTPPTFPEPHAVQRALGWAAVAVAVAMAVAPIILGLLAQIAVPGLLRASVDRLRAAPVESLGLGLLCAVLFALLGLALIISLAGIPAAIVVLAVLLTLGAISFVAAAYAIGLFIRERLRQRPPEPRFIARMGWTVLGLVILALIMAVPFFGAVIIMLLLLASLGAVARSTTSRVRPISPSAP